MRRDWTHLEPMRAQPADKPPTMPGDTWGAFVIRRHKTRLRVVACDGEETGWEHVSVSPMNEKRTPTWEEMALVKSLFWEPEECVVEFHPPESDYVNHNPFVLHLWRPTGEEMPRPPSILV